MTAGLIKERHAHLQKGFLNMIPDLPVLLQTVATPESCGPGEPLMLQCESEGLGGECPAEGGQHQQGQGRHLRLVRSRHLGLSPSAPGHKGTISLALGLDNCSLIHSQSLTLKGRPIQTLVNHNCLMTYVM